MGKTKELFMKERENDFYWNDDKVIDFVNWYIKLHKLPFNYVLENQNIIDSFKNGDKPEIWCEGLPMGPEFSINDNIKVLSGFVPFLTTIKKIEWDEQNESWKYYFDDEEGKQCFGYGNEIEIIT